MLVLPEYKYKLIYVLALCCFCMIILIKKAMVFKVFLHPKMKFCNFLLTLVPFQTCIISTSMEQNTRMFDVNSESKSIEH